MNIFIIDYSNYTEDELNRIHKSLSLLWLNTDPTHSQYEELKLNLYEVRQCLKAFKKHEPIDLTAVIAAALCGRGQ